jgi:hypothetical protein
LVLIAYGLKIGAFVVDTSRLLDHRR